MPPRLRRPEHLRRGHISLPRLSRIPQVPHRQPCRAFISPRPVERASLRFASTNAPTTILTPKPAGDRSELETLLLELQTHGEPYVNLPLLQLALRSLGREAGAEPIRIAIVGLTGREGRSDAAKKVLRLVLADPLVSEEAWERQLVDYDTSTPLVVRVGEGMKEVDGGSSVVSKKPLLRQLSISSPTFNGHDLELLLFEHSLEDQALPGGSGDGSMLVLPVKVDVDNGQAPLLTPVHKTLIVADGILGVSDVVSLPGNQKTTIAAVNIPDYPSHAEHQFKIIDVNLAAESLALIRHDLSNAMEYERTWYRSNMQDIRDWLRDGTQPTEGETKPAVRELISVIFRDALAALEAAESQRLASSTTKPHSEAGPLDAGVAEWAQNAHSELQEELDTAFQSRKWRQLRWWKLLWRVDDVGFLTSEMLSQRFLPSAEKELVFLAGRLQEATNTSLPIPYAQPTPDTSTPSPQTNPKKWPTHISFTRTYLQNQTIPALQALAQNLVLQTASGSALATSLAALLYLSSFSLYESGAVAAAGIVWSLRRLQSKWQAAQTFWEGDVREEGRKAVRAAERSALGALSVEDGHAVEGGKVREIVGRGEEILERMK